MPQAPLQVNSWKPTDNRFVSFIDIMGFKDYVSRNNHADVYNRMLQLSDLTELIKKIGERDSEGGKEIYLRIASFSDSIVLFTKDESLGSFYFITRATGILFSQAIESGIPLKGAMSFGQISVNQSKQIYVGQPIIDCYQLQDDLHYYGVVAHHSVENYLRNDEKRKKRGPMNSAIEGHWRELATPMKSGQIMYYNLNYFGSLDSVESCLSKIRLTVSGPPRKYVDNTLEVHRRLKS